MYHCMSSAFWTTCLLRVPITAPQPGKSALFTCSFSPTMNLSDTPAFSQEIAALQRPYQLRAC